MISVYLLHSEAYYGVGNISWGHFLKPFYVNAFFFVSGYLFFKKQISTTFCNDSSSPLTQKHIYQTNLANILYRIILPTIIFSSLIYIPKLLFHDNDITVKQYLYDVFGGTSFWFTSTLAVSQIILITPLLFKQKNIFLSFIISLMIFILAYQLRVIDQTPFPWYYKSGMGATLFMTIGGLYWKYEKKTDQIIGKYGFLCVCLIYVTSMWHDYHEPHALCAIMSMNINLSGMITSILGIAFCVGIAKVLPTNNLLTYIGKNSITYYFFSGAVPATIGFLFQNLTSNKYYITTLLVAILSILISTIITMVINHYCVYLLDFRKLSFLSNEKK